MNRKKKLNQILQKRLKAAKAKGAGNKKDKYVSKAERARLEAAAELETGAESEDPTSSA
ncbi:DUF2986 domain-containing protein [Alteromonadaceae bacterium BrNp21-10]|nr:DUF2986 domain-containing protein [Alteromonadaceae bacterium BrNp21-10]